MKKKFFLTSLVLNFCFAVMLVGCGGSNKAIEPKEYAPLPENGPSEVGGGGGSDAPEAPPVPK